MEISEYFFKEVKYLRSAKEIISYSHCNGLYKNTIIKGLSPYIEMNKF